MQDLKEAIRDIPDFPKKGIIFKDITPLLKDGKKFKKAVNEIVKEFKDKKVDIVVSVEARGFIFGAAVAYRLGAGLVPVRKKNKLPHLTRRVTYDLEYGTDTLEIHQDAISKGDRVLIVDDLLATGGTTKATIDLIKGSGGRVVASAFLIELTFLNPRRLLKGRKIFSLIKY